MTEIIRSPGFDEALNAVSPEDDDVLAGLLWILRRTPSTYDLVPGTDLRVAVSQGQTPVRLFYRYDEPSAKVELVTVEAL